MTDEEIARSGAEDLVIEFEKIILAAIKKAKAIERLLSEQVQSY